VILAHQAVAPSELARSWTFEPVVLTAVVLAGAVYGYGAARLGRRIPNRGGSTQAAAFYVGLAVLLIALVSPVDAAASTLFSGHMVQHLLLMVVAAPLLAYARPAPALLSGLPSVARHVARRPWPGLHRLTTAATTPIIVWIAGAVALWAWHMPALYELALQSDAVHALEHASFLATALLLWNVVMRSGSRRGVDRPVALLLVLASAVQGSALGAVLLFASTPLYGAHEHGAQLWDVSPLQDQQLAGGLMWLPPTLLYLVTMGWLLVRWFAEMERQPEGGELRLVAVGEHP
jgi:putative membrane protein